MVSFCRMNSFVHISWLPQVTKSGEFVHEAVTTKQQERHTHRGFTSQSLALGHPYPLTKASVVLESSQVTAEPRCAQTRGNISDCLIPQQLSVWTEGFSASPAHQSRPCAVEHHRLGLAGPLAQQTQGFAAVTQSQTTRCCREGQVRGSYSRILNAKGDRSRKRGGRRVHFD